MDPFNVESVEPLGNWLEWLVCRATHILDAGCGPTGAQWWGYKPSGTLMTAVDLSNRPQALPSNTLYVQSDISHYCLHTCDPEVFDLIIADHILEHVNTPLQVVYGFNRALKMGGWVHIGVPDASNFTDRFYRLIHPDGGGHISLFTRQSLLSMMEQAGFACLAIRPWGDDWGWLQNLYDPVMNGIKYSSKEDIQYVANVFQKELTLEKGYFYGWEAIFQKKQALTQISFERIISESQQNSISAWNDPGKAPGAGWTVEPLNEEEIIELRWISQRTRRLKKTIVYRILKRLFRQ